MRLAIFLTKDKSLIVESLDSVQKIGPLDKTKSTFLGTLQGPIYETFPGYEFTFFRHCLNERWRALGPRQ